jgi:hypothetical protein
MDRRNANRAFKKLVVWNDAVDLYILACRAFRDFPFELMHYKVENGLLKLVESLRKKRDDLLGP